MGLLDERWHPDVNDSWMVACRSADAEAREAGTTQTMEDHGVDLKVLAYVAQQRALRLVLKGSNREKTIQKYAEEVEAGERVQMGMAIEMSEEEEAAVQNLTAVYMEALYIGYRAAQIKPGDYPHWDGPGSDIRIPPR